MEANWLGQKVSEKEVQVYQFKFGDGIIAMMDCGGSNVSKINEQIPGIVKLLATSRIDHPEVKAKERAEELGVPLVELDFAGYEAARDVLRGDYLRALDPEQVMDDAFRNQVITVRKNVCAQFRSLIEKKVEGKGLYQDMPVFAAGFMQLLSTEFVDRYFILNVHPGDLTKYIVEGLERGKRLVTGDAWKPSAKALSAGHETLYSSIHRMTPEMDDGPVLMRGYGLPINYNQLSHLDLSDSAVLKEVGGLAQEALKYLGDHVIAGAAFMDLFDRKWALHDSGVLAYNLHGFWYLAPNGITIDDHVANNPRSPFQRDELFLSEKIDNFYEAVENLT